MSEIRSPSRARRNPLGQRAGYWPGRKAQTGAAARSGVICSQGWLKKGDRFGFSVAANATTFGKYFRPESLRVVGNGAEAAERLHVGLGTDQNLKKGTAGQKLSHFPVL